MRVLTVMSSNRSQQLFLPISSSTITQRKGGNSPTGAAAQRLFCLLHAFNHPNLALSQKIAQHLLYGIQKDWAIPYQCVQVWQLEYLINPVLTFSKMLALSISFVAVIVVSSLCLLGLILVSHDVSDSDWLKYLFILCFQHRLLKPNVATHSCG